MAIVQERMIALIQAAKAFKDQREYLREQILFAMQQPAPAEHKLAALAQIAETITFPPNSLEVFLNEAAHFKAYEKINIRKRKRKAQSRERAEDHFPAKIKPAWTPRPSPQASFSPEDEDGSLPPDTTPEEAQRAELGYPVVREVDGRKMCYLPGEKPYPLVELPP